MQSAPFDGICGIVAAGFCRVVLRAGKGFDDYAERSESLGKPCPCLRTSSASASVGFGRSRHRLVSEHDSSLAALPSGAWLA